MRRLRQPIWTLVFLADRGADEPRGLGLVLLMAVGLGAVIWWAVQR